MVQCTQIMSAPKRGSRNDPFLPITRPNLAEVRRFGAHGEKTRLANAYRSPARAAIRRGAGGKTIVSTSCSLYLQLFLLLPLFVLLNIAIKLDSRGPVILRQRRYGFDRNEFTAYSFRTTHWQGGGGAVRQSQPNILGQPNDDDLTRIGRVLRTAGIDKLPQLLNVLRGDMSLVGPLPPAHAHGDEHTKALADYAFRHRIRPGITGLAQIGEVPSTDQVELIKQIAILELWYVNNWSIWLDLKIVVRSCLERTRPQDSFKTTTDRNPRQVAGLVSALNPQVARKRAKLTWCHAVFCRIRDTTIAQLKVCRYLDRVVGEQPLSARSATSDAFGH